MPKNNPAIKKIQETYFCNLAPDILLIQISISNSDNLNILSYNNLKNFQWTRKAEFGILLSLVLVKGLHLGSYAFCDITPELNTRIN